MLYNIIQAVILLSFLLAVALEAGLLLIILQEEEPKKVITPPTFTLNPKKRAENKKKTEEMKKFETLLNNIDAYDGTTFGQKDIE